MAPRTTPNLGLQLPTDLDEQSIIFYNQSFCKLDQLFPGGKIDPKLIPEIVTLDAGTF